jgi:predicted nucleic acid-binding protein
VIHGIDTGFLVAAELLEHPDNQKARTRLTSFIAAGDSVAIAAQVLAEFIHVVTDAKRFLNPMTINVARDAAQKWWTAKEVIPTYPNADAIALFFAWHRQHALGRKRLLDTLLAATYRSAGISSLLTTNRGDFQVLGGFQCITP